MKQFCPRHSCTSSHTMLQSRQRWSQRTDWGAIQMIDGVPSGDAVRKQLAWLLEIEAFKKAKMASALLSFIVKETLRGKPPSETDIAIKVYGKPKDWQPSEGSDVRTGVKRLKNRLTEYYREWGTYDLVVIEFVYYAAVWSFNQQSPAIASRPDALTLDFGGELERYFADPTTGEFRCIVTGESAVWHRLDGDPYNNAMGNLVPLCPRLQSHIEGLKEGTKKTNLPELRPIYLAELARTHFANWRLGSAYACAHLAFYMGEPPFGNETPDLRIQHLADCLSHVRHRFNESIVAYIIRHSLLPLVIRLGSLDPRSLFNVTLQLSGILDEGAHFVTATRALLLAERVAKRFGSIIFQPGTLHRFSLLRRRAQLLMEHMPTEARFDYLARQLEEEGHNNPNLPFTLQVVRTHRWFRQATLEASRKTYESLSPVVARFNDIIFGSDQLTKPRQVDSANLAAMFISSGIAACQVRPGRWQEYADEMLAKGKLLCQETGYALPAEFMHRISDQTLKQNPLAIPVSLMPRSFVMQRLRESARRDIETVLSCLEKVLILEKADPALNWRSPWSGPHSTQGALPLPDYNSRK
jgi:hypothetical protein